MIHIIASIHIKEGRKAAFLEIFKANVPRVLKEKGCIEYTPTVDIDAGLPPQEMDPNTVTIIEKWAGLEDLQTHLSAPHMLAYREKVKEMVVKMSLKVLTAA